MAIGVSKYCVCWVGGGRSICVDEGGEMVMLVRLVARNALQGIKGCKRVRMWVCACPVAVAPVVVPGLATGVGRIVLRAAQPLEGVVRRAGITLPRAISETAVHDQRGGKATHRPQTSWHHFSCSAGYHV